MYWGSVNWMAGGSVNDWMRACGGGEEVCLVGMNPWGRGVGLW